MDTDWTSYKVWVSVAFLLLTPVLLLSLWVQILSQAPQHLFHLLFEGHHHPNTCTLASGETLSVHPIQLRRVCDVSSKRISLGATLAHHLPLTKKSTGTQTPRFQTWTHFTGWKGKQRTTVGGKSIVCEQIPFPLSRLHWDTWVTSQSKSFLTLRLAKSNFLSKNHFKQHPSLLLWTLLC